MYSVYKGFSKEIYVLAFSKFIVSMGSFISPYLVIILKEKYYFDIATTGIIMTIVGVLYFPGSLLGGILGDKYNAKTNLFITQCLAGMSFIISIFFEGIILKISCICLSVFFSSMTYSLSDIVIINIADKNNFDKKKIFSLTYLFHNLGFSIGLYIGSLLLLKNINISFLGDGATTIISAILILFLVSYDINKKKEKVIEKENIPFLDFFKKNIWIILLLALFLSLKSYIYFQYKFSLPLFVNDSFGYNNGVLLYSKMILFNTFSVLFFTPLITKYFYKIDSKYFLLLSIIFYGIGFGGYFFAGKDSFLYFIFTIIWSIGEIFSAVGYMPYLTNIIDLKYIGRTSSLLYAISRGSSYLSPIITGYVLSFYKIKFIWLFLMVISLFNLMIIIILFKIISIKERRNSNGKL